MFRDARRPIDYVIAVKPNNMDRLATYLENLEALGLEFETEPGQAVDLVFVKVHLPKTALEHFSDIYDVGKEEPPPPSVDTGKFTHPFPTPASRISPKRKGQITNAERIMIAYRVLQNTQYGPADVDYGIEKLIRSGVVADAYPLHETGGGRTNQNDRELLLTHFANMASVHKQVPADLIKKYLGPEIAFYFAWLEYFNLMLVFPALLGAVIFFVATVFPASRYTSDVCEATDVYLCPTCENRKSCRFKPLSRFCAYGRWTQTFDNNFTVFFAIFMSFWATMFINMWRRKENILKLKWRLAHEQIETDIRQVHADTTKYARRSPITDEIEPFTPRMFIVLRFAVTLVTCGFLIAIVIAALFVIIVIKLYATAWWEQSRIDFFASNSWTISMVLGSVLQVCFIKLFSKVYGPVSIRLTNLENPRTQTQFDNSVLYKRYLLAFVNNYAPLFYIAFVQGRLYSTPDRVHNVVEKDVCQPFNCITVLCIQLGLILTLKSLAGNVLNLVLPLTKRRFQKWFAKQTGPRQVLPRWEEEYHMTPADRYVLTTEFTEMIIKYGFVTFFVAAFPLAPLCAVVNNLLELRFDAYKFLKVYRRPLPIRKSGIGAWNGVLLSVTFISTATNAFVLFFTTDVVPRTIYTFEFGRGLDGFLNSTLSRFATAHQPLYQRIPNKQEICFYRGHYYPPEAPLAYQLTFSFWKDLVFRAAAVFIFEHIILISNTIIAYVIPKCPFAVKQQLNLDVKKDREVQQKMLRPGPEKHDIGGVRTRYILEKALRL